MCELTLLHFLLHLNYIRCFNLTANSSDFRSFISCFGRLSAIYRQYRSFNGSSIFYRTFIGHTGHLTDIYPTYPTKFTLFICAINVHFVQLLCNGAFSFKILLPQLLNVLFNFFQALLFFY